MMACQNWQVRSFDTTRSPSLFLSDLFPSSNHALRNFLIIYSWDLRLILFTTLLTLIFLVMSYCSISCKSNVDYLDFRKILFAKIYIAF